MQMILYSSIRKYLSYILWWNQHGATTQIYNLLFKLLKIKQVMPTSYSKDIQCCWFISYCIKKYLTWHLMISPVTYKWRKREMTPAVSAANLLPLQRLTQRIEVTSAFSVTTIYLLVYYSLITLTYYKFAEIIDINHINLVYSLIQRSYRRPISKASL